MRWQPHERVRNDALIRRRQRIEPPAELVEAAILDPAREPLPDISRIDTGDQ